MRGIFVKHLNQYTVGIWIVTSLGYNPTWTSLLFNWFHYSLGHFSDPNCNSGFIFADSLEMAWTRWSQLELRRRWKRVNSWWGGRTQWGKSSWDWSKNFGYNMAWVFLIVQDFNDLFQHKLKLCSYPFDWIFSKYDV